jgi:hypothetical protein
MKAVGVRGEAVKLGTKKRKVRRFKKTSNEK